MAKKIITAQMMDDLFIDAMGGDSIAEAEYRDLARLLAKRNNQQMLEQEHAGVTGESYRRAQSFLGDASRFRENNKKIDITDLRNQVDEMLAFQSGRDYSLSYARKSIEEIENLSESMMAAGVDTSDETVMFWMNELFKTGAWQEYKKAHGRSTNLIQQAQEQFKAGKTVDDLLAAYNDYKEKRDDLPTSWEKFAVASW